MYVRMHSPGNLRSFDEEPRDVEGEGAGSRRLCSACFSLDALFDGLTMARGYRHGIRRVNSCRTVVARLYGLRVVERHHGHFGSHILPFTSTHCCRIQEEHDCTGCARGSARSHGQPGHKWQAEVQSAELLSSRATTFVATVLSSRRFSHAGSRATGRAGTEPCRICYECSIGMNARSRLAQRRTRGPESDVTYTS